MNNPFQLLTVCLLFASVGLCQTTEQTTMLHKQRFETSLASGANLRLHLHDGDLRIVGTDSEKISVHFEGKNVEQAKDINIKLHRLDGTVDLTLSRVPKNDLQVTIEIPRQRCVSC